MSLEAEIKDLKDRAAVNVDIFQKKNLIPKFVLDPKGTPTEEIICSGVSSRQTTPEYAEEIRQDFATVLRKSKPPLDWIFGTYPIYRNKKEISCMLEKKTVLKLFSETSTNRYFKKLADQERKYQAELETWKAAELNRSMYQEVQSSGVLQYDARNSYQPGRSTWEHPYQHPTTPTQSFISRVRNVQQRPIQPNIVHPLQAYTDYHSPGRFYLENRNPNVTEEREEDKTEKPTNNPNSSAAGQKPKILVPSKRKKLFHPSMNIL
ncbi:hypothetical protein J6590_027220 [Homalodisca vitripennis]|nr:hypothetical protein J6590_027220 [Homalodisca vitripennis]